MLSVNFPGYPYGMNARFFVTMRGLCRLFDSDLDLDMDQLVLLFAGSRILLRSRRGLYRR